MYTNEVKSNNDLCYKLGMDFNEANELFGSETLNGMQMMQVNGGWKIPWDKVWKGIQSVADFAANCITIAKSAFGSTTTEALAPETPVQAETKGNNEVIFSLKEVIISPMQVTTTADSVKVKTGNGTTEVTVYNLQITLTPPTN